MFYLINKPLGISSFQAIKKFARDNQIKKIGHSGTLDPLATGALLVATGDDTKLLPYVTNQTKTYLVTFELGYISDTFDATGKMEKMSSKVLAMPTIAKILKQLIGKSMQVPPPFSAKKINGQRSYLLARKGVSVVLKSVPIEVFHITKLRQIRSNVFSFEILVSSGTYIRSLIHNLGIKLKTGAIMTALHRVQVGNQKLLQAQKIVNPFAIIKLPQLKIDDLLKLWKGQLIITNYKDGLYLLVFKKQIVGIGNVKKKLLKSNKLFGNRIAKLLAQTE